MKLRFLMAVALAVFATLESANADLTSDDFSYADGSALAGQGDWTSHNGAGSSSVLIDAGRAVLTHGGGSREDVNISFAAVNSNILRASFDIVVQDDAAITGTDAEYFAHFMNENNDFTSRVDVQAANGTGDFTLGISTSTSTAEATLSSDFSFGSVVSLILDYDFTSGTSSLTVDGETITGEILARGSLSQFALRQSNSSSDETIFVDNLVVTAVPEPSSMGVLALAGLVFLRRKRS